MVLWVVGSVDRCFTVEVKPRWLGFALCEFIVERAEVYGLLGSSDAAMISASQVLNATETYFLEPQDTAARPSRKMNPN